MGQNKPNVPPQQMNQLGDFYNRSQSAPSPTESEFTPVSQGMTNQYINSMTRGVQNYDDIMSQYQKFNPNATAARPGQVQTAYDTLGKAGAGYADMASTGGYSAQDIQDLRARGMSPITSAYANTMRELDRARTLGGGGSYAPNYIAAVSRAQRTQPQQLSDAMQGVNANLAESIRQGKLAGLAGETQVGAETGGLAAQEAGRMDAATRAAEQEKLASIGGQASLYGTTPGQASTFGNQVLSAYGLRTGMEGQRNAQGLQALGDYVSAFTGAPRQIPWWQTALGAAGDVAPFFAM